MAEKVLQFDEKALLGELNNLEKVLLPRASYISLNKAVFDARIRLQNEAKNRFKNVSRLTNSSFLYEKPKQMGNILEASVFIRSRIPKGNAPSKYLAPQIYGGMAYRTRFQRALERSQTYIGRDSEPILSADKIMSPATKLTPRTYSVIAGQMRGISKPKDKRYFYMGDKSVKKSGYKKGIYMRQNKKLKFILKEIDTPSYSGKFKFFDYAKDEIGKSFKKNLLEQLKRT
tara:strand:- start:395 stop:1084 length:690 start_codon:yes stop_codon:yes gene_type:complete